MKRVYVVITIIFMGVLCLNGIHPVSADFGPKPSIDIEVIGLNDTEYYLDLLVEGVEPTIDDGLYHDLTDELKAKLLPMRYFYMDGYAILLNGAPNAPIFGDIQGTEVNESTMNHRFSYMGVPESFKVLIYFGGEKYILTEQIEKQHFNAKIVIDLSQYTIPSEDGIYLLDSEYIQTQTPTQFSMGMFFVRIGFTLAIELGIAYLFGFHYKRAMIIFGVTNIVTQIALNIGILVAGNVFLAVFMLLFFEAVVLIVELITYMIALKSEKRLKILLYTVLANFASLIAGILLITIP